jgi:hypothetical protein
MNPDGTPGELFLPWRTTVARLAGAEYVGQFQLTSGAVNHVFAREGRATVVTWSPKPVVEDFFQGDNVTVTDLWGRNVPLTTASDSDSETTAGVPIGALPVFIDGMDEFVAKWRVGLEFADRQLGSVFGREQNLVLTLRNPFPHAIAGEVSVQLPKAWEGSRLPHRFRVGEGQELRLPIPLTLTLDANSGPQTLRFDFNLQAQQRQQFHVYRTVQVGWEDVGIEMQSRLLEDNQLQLDLILQNKSETPVSFNWTLFPPGRRRETQQVINLPAGRTSFRMVLPRGDELVGERIFLRAEELGGDRVINQSVIVGK